MYYDRFDIVEAHYWWNADHHEGMSSWGYKRLSHIGSYFEPGILSNGPAEGNAREIYDNLCGKEGCCSYLFPVRKGRLPA